MLNARALNVPSPYKESAIFVWRPMVSAPARSTLGFFRWVFVIANVKQAILGADFLQHFGLACGAGLCLIRLLTSGLTASPPTLLWHRATSLVYIF